MIPGGRNLRLAPFSRENPDLYGCANAIDSSQMQQVLVLKFKLRHGISAL
jgi:hypothetical protein